MAHQAHNIPWQTLIRHLSPLFRDGEGAPKWLHNVSMPKSGAKDKKDNATNFYTRSKPGQSKDLNYFAEAFALNIENHTQSERQKYPARYEPPAEDDIVLTDALVKKLNPVVLYVRTNSMRGRRDQDMLTGEDYAPIGTRDNAVCQHKNEAQQVECPCIIPYKERQTQAFLRHHQSNDCYRFLEVNAKSFFSMEVVKTMVLYGEMDTVLRLCSLDDNDYKTWHHMAPCYDENHDAGWDVIYKRALDMYLCLNICYCFPELWDSESGRTKVRDYRNTHAYQSTLENCTEIELTSDVPSLPHRQFFGLADETFAAYSEAKTRKCSPGTVAWRDFLEARGCAPDPFLLSPAAFSSSEMALRRAGLPGELVDNIRGYFGRAATTVSDVPLDPLHPKNSDKLRRYLTYCWQLVIRCSVMAEALGLELDWKSIVVERLTRLLSSRVSKWFQVRTGEDHHEYTVMFV